MPGAKSKAPVEEAPAEALEVTPAEKPEKPEKPQEDPRRPEKTSIILKS